MQLWQQNGLLYQPFVFYYVEKQAQILIYTYIALCACATTVQHEQSGCVLECRDTSTSHCVTW